MSLKSTDSAILFGLSILLSIVLRGNPLAVGIFFLPLSVPLSHSFATHHRRSRR